MKPFYLFVLIVLFITSCQKVSHNGKLDGMWQLIKIEENNGEANSPERMYYSFQLNLINLRQVGNLYLLGYFRQTKDSLYIVMRETTKEAVAPYGLSDTIQTFGIEQLTSKKMILYSPENRLYFRKF